MSAIIRPLSLCLLLLISSAGANDAFQVLRDDAAGFAEVLPGKTLSFPADHAPHPDYRIEWWYLTANLLDEQGQQWGLQWTLFRQALSAKESTTGWSNNHLWMAHAAVSTPDRHRFEQRFTRGGIGQAGVKNDDHFEAWIDDWTWRSDSNSPLPAQLKFNVDDFQIDMQLTSSADWVLHGDQGYSQKSQQGQASYYYSQPQIQISGTINGQVLSGSAWLDREWSSQALAKNQRGWDWFSLHLDDGNKLMLYRLRHDDGEDWLSGSWIEPDGSQKHLSSDAIEMNEQTLREVKTNAENSVELPLDWRVELPSLNRQLHIKPLYDQQWMGTRFPYWEGVVLVEDDVGKQIGKGYMELTGYE
jgi:predicted secreted hydrolase